MKKIVLKKQIAHYYQHLFTLIPKAQHIILHSGRGTTKSTFFSMYDLFRLLYYPNADIMVIGYEYESMIDSVFGDYRNAAEYLQIPKQHIEFYTTKNGESWIKVRNKWGGVNKIWFEHAKRGAEGFKGKNPTSGNRWLSIRFYELTNFVGWDGMEVENTIATFTRKSYKTFLWNKIEQHCKDNNLPFEKDEDWLFEQKWYQENPDPYQTHEFCVEYEFNTPSAADKGGAWVMDWLETKKKQLNVWYQFNNYLDMDDSEKLKFLGADALHDIDQLKLVDPIKYNHIYLGKAAYDGDIVFPMLNRQTHFGKHDNFQPDILVIGVDVGRSDPTVITLNGFEYKFKDMRIALGMHRWSHCNRKCQFIKDGVMQPYRNWSLKEYANMILEFCDMVHNEYPWARIYFQMDREGAGKDFYDACFEYGAPMYMNVDRLWKKQSPSVRIDAIQTALTVPGVVKIYDPVLFSAYRNQLWDNRKREEDGERKRLDDPSKPNLDMDSQDSCEYGWPSWFFQICKERIIKGQGKFNGGR